MHKKNTLTLVSSLLFRLLLLLLISMAYNGRAHSHQNAQVGDTDQQSEAGVLFMLLILFCCFVHWSYLNAWVGNEQAGPLSLLSVVSFLLVLSLSLSLLFLLLLIVMPPRWVTSKQKLDRPRADFSLLKIPQKRSRRSSPKRWAALLNRYRVKFLIRESFYWK